jgi:pimeloyl-ACP methyl ester carboxylesterase
MAQRIVYLHGVPQFGGMWTPFIERTGGEAPDLPGFGASEKPASGDYTFRGLGRWVAEYTAGTDRFSLVVHDWGAVGLLAAMERPEALEKLVIINAVPFLPGYRWHSVARAWRTRVVGELMMGLSSKRGLKLLAKRQGRTTVPDSVLDGAIDEIWRHFDHGTQRAILRLYRSAPEDVLAEAGARLREIKAPALVVWGREDPYLPTEFATKYADALGGPTEVALIDGAGHWPWYEKPEVIDRVAAFLRA